MLPWSRNRQRNLLCAVAALGTVCVVLVFQATHTTNGEGLTVELMDGASFWSDDDSLWNAPEKSNSGGRHGQLNVAVKGNKRVQALHKAHAHMLAGGEQSSFMNPEAIYQAAFHEAFQKTYAKTYGESLGEAEGRLTAQAQWAKTQMDSLSKQEKQAIPVEAGPSVLVWPVPASVPVTAEPSAPAAEPSAPVAAMTRGLAGSEMVIAGRVPGEEDQEDQEEDEIPLGLPQDIRHYIKPYGEWIKGPKHLRAAATAQEAPVPEEEKDGEETRNVTEISVKKFRSWDSVPLGAATHMRHGPEYTGGVERFAPTVKHCPGGNCVPLESRGVNVDSWRGFNNPSRTVPWPGLDPSNDRRAIRAQNARVGRWARYNTGHNPGRWGAAAEPLDDPTAYRLERHGVNVMGDKYVRDILHHAIALPALDDKRMNTSTMRGDEVPMDAEEALAREQLSSKRLEDAGVSVNGGAPAEVVDRAYSHTDGIADNMVTVESGAPKYRREGVVLETEQPMSFLLRDAVPEEHVEPAPEEEHAPQEGKAGAAEEAGVEGGASSVVVEGSAEGKGANGTVAEDKGAEVEGAGGQEGAGIDPQEAEVATARSETGAKYAYGLGLDLGVASGSQLKPRAGVDRVGKRVQRDEWASTLKSIFG